MSSDPNRIENFLYPTSYASGFDSYFDIAVLLSWLYFLPLVLGLGAAKLVSLMIKNKTAHHWSELAIVIAPAACWLALIYADASTKAAHNIFELSAIGAIIGAVIGIRGRLVSSWLNGLSTCWIICAVALAMWIYVPRIPYGSLSW